MTKRKWKPDHNARKDAQLGMNFCTASARLKRDILFNLIKDTPCFRCGGVLTRETFTIDHKISWLDSANPIENFFNLENISFSHAKCNYKTTNRRNRRLVMVPLDK